MSEEDRRYVRDAFTFWVRSGFEDERELSSEIETRILDLIGETDEAFIEEITNFVQHEFEAQREREASWEEETVNDHIDEAFAEMWDSGIIALQNAGYTMSEGWEDVAEARADIEEPRGAVFYHQQDTERAVEGAGLMLAFGAFTEGEAHVSDSLAIAAEVCNVLRKYGLDVNWDGSIQHRIEIRPFTWRKRQG